MNLELQKKESQVEKEGGRERSLRDAGGETCLPGI